MSDGPTLRDTEDIVCVVDVSNEGAGGLCWFRRLGRCSFYHRPLPPALYGTTSRDACRVELTNLVAAVGLWAPRWAGSSVLVRCDNPCVTRGSSSSQTLMTAALAALSRQHGFSVRLEWSIQRQDPLMAAADRLSRIDKPRKGATLHEATEVLMANLPAGTDAERQRGPNDQMFCLDGDA